VGNLGKNKNLKCKVIIDNLGYKIEIENQCRVGRIVMRLILFLSCGITNPSSVFCVSKLRLFY
jgi:hypothetical protein